MSSPTFGALLCVIYLAAACAPSRGHTSGSVDRPLVRDAGDPTSDRSVAEIGERLEVDGGAIDPGIDASPDAAGPNDVGSADAEVVASDASGVDAGRGNCASQGPIRLEFMPEFIASPYGVDCGGVRRHVLSIDYVTVENAGQQTLTGLRTRWRVAFTSDGETVEEDVPLRAFGQWPTVLAPGERQSHLLSAPVHSPPGIALACGRCGRELELITTFESNETSCFEVHTPLGVLICR